MRLGGMCTSGLAALALALVLATPASALQFGAGAGVAQPLLLRISGFVGGAPQSVPTLGRFTLGVGKAIVTLDLSAVQTLNGPLTEGPAALQLFDLYTPNLVAVGEEAVLRGLTGAPLHTQITLFGYIRAGARRMYVVQVETV